MTRLEEVKAVVAGPGDLEREGVSLWMYSGYVID